MIDTTPPGPAHTVLATVAPDRLRHWLREPLLHFFLIGALVFGLDRAIVIRAGDPHTIVVDAAVDNEARQVFQASRGREPNAEELKALRERWIDNEVLYREGLAMQVDRGDSAIRDRVIFKALSVVDASTKLPPIEDRVLRQWFDARRDKYEEPARFDFQEAVLSGDRSEAGARNFAAALNSGTPGDATAGLRVFKGRPHANLVQSYGEDFAKAMEQAPLGRWVALHSRGAWRVVQLESTSEAKPAVFETLRGVVLQDWTDQTMAEQRTAAVRTLGRKYSIRRADPLPGSPGTGPAEQPTAVAGQPQPPTPPSAPRVAQQ